jgi:hypothetical protein
MIDSMSCIHIKNRLDYRSVNINFQTSLLTQIDLFCCCQIRMREIRVIVVSKCIQEMICNNKQSANSYELSYQLIDPVMISFTRQFRVSSLIAWIICYVNIVMSIWK